MKSVATFVFVAATMVAIAAPAMAQARPSAPAKTSPTSTVSSDSTADFGIGYSFLHFDGTNAAAGFDAFYAKDFRSMNSGSLGFVGDVSVNHASEGTGEFVTGGVRASFKGSSKAKFYGQVTGGLSHFPSESQLVIDFGGGVKLPMEGKKFGLYAQVDFPVVFFSGDTQTGLRLNVGVTVPVGK
jgi:hypothetical protein